MIVPLDDEVRDLLTRVSVATVTTQLFRRGLGNTFLYGVAPQSAGAVQSRMVGEAVTLRYTPAREDLDVLAVFGPHGGPGMPEWGMLPIPDRLLREGVRDMVRISDARMSGTAYGTCVLHAPRIPRGYGALYARQVLQADEGCDFDILADPTPVPEPAIH